MARSYRHIQQYEKIMELKITTNQARVQKNGNSIVPGGRENSSVMCFSASNPLT